MNYVKSFNVIGTDVAQIPCIRASGAPTKTTTGDVGSLYMDTDTGNLYKCVSVTEDSYVWETMSNADDSKVGDKPWSSKNIVNKLCPPFTEIGSAAICEPVEGYPLEVVSHINPKSDGTEWESITLKQCGKNILDTINPKVYHQNASTPQLLYTLTDTGVRMEALRDLTNLWSRAGFYIGTKQELAGMTITVSGVYTSLVVNDKNIPHMAFSCTNIEPCRDNSNIIIANGGYIGTTGTTKALKNGITGNSSLTYTVTGEEDMDYIYVGLLTTYGGSMAVGDWTEWSDIQVEIGNAATEYEPYRGRTFTVDFTNAPEIEGGGYYNWNTGLMNNGASPYLHNPTTGWFDMIQDESEASTVIRSIPALPGVNTIYSNCGDTVVKGRSDCNAILKNLTNAIVSLGANI